MSTKNPSEKKLRKAIISQCQWMNSSGLNQGTSGNISARHGNKLIITPSGVPYDKLKPSMLASTSLDQSGEPEWSGKLKPSSEWRFHLDIMRARPEAGAIVHTHSPHATALAMLRKPIPACHYMIAAFGGDDIRCAGYTRYGTQALSKLALAALEGRAGCLLANHGMITVGDTLDKAMWLAVELEALARQYLLALNAGKPVLLNARQIAETAAGFASYGLLDPDTASAADGKTAVRPQATRKPAGQKRGRAAEPATGAPDITGISGKGAAGKATAGKGATGKGATGKAAAGKQAAVKKPARAKPVRQKPAKSATEKSADPAKAGRATPRQRRLI